MRTLVFALGLALLLGAGVPVAQAGDTPAEPAAAAPVAAPASAPADAKARLAALQKTLAEIQKSLKELDKRLADLEKAMDKEERGEAAKPTRPKPKKAEPKKDDGEKKDGEKPPEGEPEKPEGDAAEEEPADEAEPGAAEEEGEKEPGIDPAILEIAGTYTLDVDSVVESAIAAMLEEAGDELPPEFAEMFAEQLRKQLEASNLEFVFETDLTWAMTGQTQDEDQSASGTWSRDGDELRILQTHENGEESDEPEVLIGTLVDDRIELRPEAEADSPMAIILVKTD